MITTAEFKSQIAKPFGIEMQKLGFKGSGFIFKKENKDFIFAIYIKGSRWGGRCSAGFAVHPKQIEKYSLGRLDLKKLPIHLYEFKMSLSKTAPGERWEYSNIQTENLQIVQKIVAAINERAVPAIQLYCNDPGLLDIFGVADLKDFHRNYTKKTGVRIATTHIRFAWAMATIFEFTNPVKARLFAEYGISQLIPGDTFFGKGDFERVLKG